MTHSDTALSPIGTAAPHQPGGRRPAIGALLAVPTNACLGWLSGHREAFGSDVRLMLIKTIFVRTTAMIFSAVSVMMLAGVSAARLPGSSWPLVWLAAEVALLIVRLLIIRRVRDALARGEPGPFYHYVVVATAWCVGLGLGACACVLTGDGLLAALAAINVCGIAAGISSRSAAFPRLAILQIALVAGPYSMGAAISHVPFLFVLAIETPLCAAAMCSLALTHHVDIINLIRAERKNWYLACHDTLTGLPNRKAIYDQLGLICADLERQATSLPTAFAVLCLDLDGFKGVNDTFGHPAGDLLLKAVADRLKLEVRAADIVGRTGGDEFVILLPGADAEEAALISSRIIAAIACPFLLGFALPLQVGTTIGSAVAPANGAIGELLLSRADEALYAGKRAGRGVYRAYSEMVATVGSDPF